MAQAENIHDLCPATTASRLPPGLKAAVLAPQAILSRMGRGAALSQVGTRNRALMNAAAKAAAKSGSPLGFVFPVTPAEASFSRVPALFDAFFRDVCTACSAANYKGPVFLQLDVPAALSGDRAREAKNLIASAVSEGFTSFSLNLKFETSAVKEIPVILGEAAGYELGIEMRFVASGERHVSKALDYLAHFGIRPFALRPVGGLITKLPEGIAYVTDSGEGARIQGHARIAMLDGVLFQSVLDAVDPRNLGDFNGLLREMGLDGAIGQAMSGGLFAGSDVDKISAAVESALEAEMRRVGAPGGEG